MEERTPETNEKTCRECGKPLGAGRSDRKYCDDICRTAFNNRRRPGGSAKPPVVYEEDPEQQSADRDRAAMEKIFAIVFANRVKLLNMFDLYEGRLTLDDFNRFGVNLKYHTSEHTDDYYGKPFKMCFDYGYHIDGNMVYITYSGNELFFN